MSAAQLKSFSAVAWFTAAVAGLCGLAMAAALNDEGAFQLFQQGVVSLYSSDGIITPAGVAIVHRVAAFLAWAAWPMALVAAIVAFLLQRVAHSPVIQDDRAGCALDRERDPVEPRWRPQVYGLAAIVLLVLGAFIRAPRLFTSLFYDEIVSMRQFASLPLLRIPFTQEGFNNHILNSMALHLMRSVSTTEAVLRLPVYVAGVVSLWLFFRLGQSLGRPLAGLFAMWIAAINPYHLWYSTLARGYMLGLCLALAGMTVLLSAPRPPTRRVMWLFGTTQVLASWAMPTLAIVPLSLAGYLLLGTLPRCRRVTGVDPRSPTGSAWLLASLWTVAIIGVANLPMIPFLVQLFANRGITVVGSSLVVGALLQGVGMVRHDPLSATLVVGLMGVGVRALLRGGWGALPWTQRFLLLLWSLSFALFLVVLVPVRIQGVAFIGFVVLVSIGLDALLVTVVFPTKSHGARAVAAGALSVACLVGMTLASRGPLRDAVRGIPLQNVRGAVQVAEAVLPPQGVILTSGWTEREIAYYAHRPIELLAPATSPAELVAAHRPFCYFRLYGNPGAHDSVYDAFEVLTPPSVVIPATDDPIALWCFMDGKAIALTQFQQGAGDVKRSS